MPVAISTQNTFDIFFCKRPNCPYCKLSLSDIKNVLPYLREEYPDYVFKLEIRARRARQRKEAAANRAV
jgi:hypothetical protein